MARFAIVGTTGSGKTMLGERMAARLGCRFVDLDELKWGPNWTEAPPEVFRERAAATLTDNAWVSAGNYSVLRDIVWARADSLVWLDYPLPFVLWRLAWRTLRRVITQEELFGGNRERLRDPFGRDSLFRYAVWSHPRRQAQFASYLAQPLYSHLKVHRFRWPNDVERWLNALQPATEKEDPGDRR